jgi:hypothetical protein
VRQAHRAALGGGFRVGPGWVVGGLLAFTLLSTGMAAGSTPTGAVAGARSIGPEAASLALAVAGEPAAEARAAGEQAKAPAPAGTLSVGTSRAGVTSGLRVLGPVLAALETDPAAFPKVRATPHPTAAAVKVSKAAAPTPKAPKPTPKLATTAKAPKPTPKLATTAKAPKPAPKPAPTPKLAPKPTPKPTPKPAPAIVYLHKAAGRATWGEFGGAVITRLPPGTQIRVCGRLGCWAGVSSGFGPSPAGGNLVDLDATIFQRISGPLATGVGSIVLSWR